VVAVRASVGIEFFSLLDKRIKRDEFVRTLHIINLPTPGKNKKLIGLGKNKN